MNNYENTSLDELIAMFNRAGQPDNLRWAIARKIGDARYMLRHHRAVLSAENVASLNANIAKAKAALGEA